MLNSANGVQANQKTGFGAFVVTLMRKGARTRHIRKFDEVTTILKKQPELKVTDFGFNRINGKQHVKSVMVSAKQPSEPLNPLSPEQTAIIEKGALSQIFKSLRNRVKVGNVDAPKEKNPAKRFIGINA